MKSISVHGIDEKLEKAIKERAKQGGKSVNKVVRELIAKALGLGERPPDNREEFADLCGAWSREEAVEFMETVADFDTVDEKDWR
ncbi:MAG: ribbon-helix-helix protein, CopG family [Acidobacteriota bacterium]|jgi:plasmid stability protein|nr:ribbon-helix-helix protein, CopG family [Acidobacteriota bacterium]